jgi:hypothetical protein
MTASIAYERTPSLRHPSASSAHLPAGSDLSWLVSFDAGSRCARIHGVAERIAAQDAAIWLGALN